MKKRDFLGVVIGVLVVIKLGLQILQKLDFI